MEWIKEFLDFVPEIIDLIGAVILLVGSSRGAIAFVKLEFGRVSGNTPWFRLAQVLRCEVGVYILLALDFMISSDIINSMLHTEIDDLISLVTIVMLRTVIGYFLGKEVDEIHLEVSKTDESV